jgi:hypothetical protein
MVLEMLVFSSPSHLTQIVAQEYFIIWYTCFQWYDNGIILKPQFSSFFFFFFLINNVLNSKIPSCQPKNIQGCI